MSTPDLHMKTLFILNADGRILSTREPGANRAPVFTLIRSKGACVWAVRSDVPEDIAGEIDDSMTDTRSVSAFVRGLQTSQRKLASKQQRRSGVEGWQRE